MNAAEPTRRVVLGVGGGLGLAAFLAACGADERPPTADTTSPPSVRITTTGATFSPTVELAAGSGATVSWVVEGGETVTGLSPTINLGEAAPRYVRMRVDDGGTAALGEVVTFNRGFNHRDDMGTYNMGAGHDKPGQDVKRVENLHRLTGLRRFSAAHTSLAGSLDFTGCSRLQYIECFKSDVESVRLDGCASLIRLVVEETNLTALDLNPVVRTLRDLRGAAQQGGTLRLTPLRAPLAALYHFCVRDQVLVNHPSAAQLPVVEELWNWNTRQSGPLRSTSNNIWSLRASSNHYSTADLTDQFPAGTNGALDAFKNSLTAVTLTGCSGLVGIDLGTNRLNTVAVDGVLAVVASWQTPDGTLNLTGNSAPSARGLASAAELAARGWKVTTD